MTETENVFIKHFSSLSNPRVERTKRHYLVDIIEIAICAVLSGAECWTDMETYAQKNKMVKNIFTIA